MSAGDPTAAGGGAPASDGRAATAPGLVVRAATALDRGAAIRLLEARLAEEGLPPDPDGVARAVEIALSAGSSAWLAMATQHGMAVGIVLANPAVSAERGGAALRLDEIYVPPERRGRGIEHALVEFVAEEARANGMRSIEAEAARAEVADVLRACGFAPIERERLSRAP